MLKPSVQIHNMDGILVAEFWDCLRLDPAPVQDLRKHVEAHLQAKGRPELVVDLSGVSFAGSAALGNFVALQRSRPPARRADRLLQRGPDGHGGLPGQPAGIAVRLRGRPGSGPARDPRAPRAGLGREGRAPARAARLRPAGRAVLAPASAKLGPRDGLTRRPATRPGPVAATVAGVGLPGPTGDFPGFSLDRGPNCDDDDARWRRTRPVGRSSTSSVARRRPGIRRPSGQSRGFSPGGI